ncbi:tetratricopeptide repeat-containing sensor histidine kinase [Chryseolinea lacunae]|uniref:histidine kinase n=1 Tax=Chryseolinea lacunae TaxID=2801331 RepID=A0ABS1KK85_9BACT|nr:tetratricopeptide repeat-containing sensor histidine kinase [Chryseolinea lacunae]MBL0739775.1 tetratricopeptide repeat-containing sensor histidine kinase [Chryseolinea lacunae]
MRYRAIFVLVLSLLPVFCFAQTSETDSLESLVKNIPSDTTKVWLLNKLVTSLRERDNTKALDYGQQAHDLAVVINYERGKGQALENLGWIYYRKGDYSKAFELSTEALAIAEKFHDASAISRCLNNVAAIRYEQKQYVVAIANFKKAYEISTTIRDSLSMSRSINNVAFSFLGMQQYDSARVYAERALKWSHGKDKLFLVGFSNRTLGDIDVHEKNYESALKKFENVVKIADQLQNVFLKVSTLHRIGKAYYLLHDTDRALSYLLQNITLASKYDFKNELERSLKLVSEIYASRKEINKAFDYQTQYLAVHDSLHNQRNGEQMALMQARFDSEMKEAKIALLLKDSLLKKEELNGQRIWIYFSAGSFVLMAILAFVLLYNNRVKKRANDELNAKNMEIEHQAQQLRNINITKDKLFSIISHDLRSPLASLRGLMDIMSVEELSREEFLTTTQKLRQNLDTVREDLDNLLFWAQSQLNGLQSHPTFLKVRPIVEEKIQLFTEIARQKEVTVVNEIDETLSVLVDRNHISLIIRNLLANALKFSKPGGLIMVREKLKGDLVEISVTDSGVGMTSADLRKLFNVETHFSNPGTLQEKGAGIGLLLTKEFIEKNGGSIWATSELGKGSTFTFTVRQDSNMVGEEV